MTANILKFILSSYLVVFISSCSNSQIEVQSQTLEYRTFDNPVKKYSKLMLTSSSSFQDTYLEWEIAHDRLVLSIDKGRLNSLEAHRITILYFDKLIVESLPSKESMLKSYIPVYQKLVSQVGTVPQYIIMRNYRKLQEDIRSILFPVQDKTL